uniref:Ig-like domain-containing protein n=1 Tax=Gopherus evgoodei TaxID=1825980 RepID=A0A8C4YJZ0_9SAUR
PEGMYHFFGIIGFPVPDVKWYRNKSLLEPDQRVRIEKEGDTCILEIHNVQKSEEGEYICHAVNIIGEAKSITQVEVLPQDGRSLALPPPVTHQHVIEFDLEQNKTSRSPSPQEILLEVELDENEAVFECTVTGSPTPQVQWFKENTCITADGRSYLVTAEKGSHCLKIQNVGHSDSGTYRCKAVNSVGETICKSSLVVLDSQRALASWNITSLTLSLFYTGLILAKWPLKTMLRSESNPVEVFLQ